MQRKSEVLRLTVMAMLTALAVVLVYFIHLPIFPAYNFLEYDPGDIPIFIGTMLFGPWYCVLMTAVVSVIQGVTVSAQSGVIGMVMHYFATGSFVVAAGLIYQRKKTFKRSVIAFSVGSAAMIAFMVLWNVIVTPAYTGMSREMVIGLLLPLFIPFNAIKAVVNSVLSLLIFSLLKRVINLDGYSF